MDKISERIAEIQKSILPINDEIIDLNSHGFSIMESIKIIRAGYSIPLADAKQIVSSHPIWKPVVEKSQNLHNMLEKVITEDDVTEINRLGGFFAFPFFPSKLDIGHYHIVWKDWLFFEFFEVSKDGSPYLKTNIDSKIIKNEKPAGHILNKENARKEGPRFEGSILGKVLATACEIKNKGNKEETYLFQCLADNKEIGWFQWKQRHPDGISGFFHNGMSEYVWFMGISLMCLWRNESDIKRLN